MALTNCPNCGNKVSTRAKACPKCGHIISADGAWSKPQHKPVAKEAYNKKGKSNGLLYAIIGLLSLIIIGGGVYMFTRDDNRSSHKNIESHHVSTELESVESASMPQESVSIPQEAASIPQEAVSMPQDAPADAADHTTKEVNHKNATYSVYGSEDVSPTQTYAADEGLVIDGKSAHINRTWLEHFVNDGLGIHIDMNTSNLLNHELIVGCFFWFKDGRKVHSQDNEYAAPDKQIATYVRVIPNDQECTYNNLKLWIPYSQIKGVRDKKILKCRVEVFYNGQCLASGNYMNFSCWKN